MPQDSASRQWICVFHAVTEFEADDAEAVLRQEHISVRRRRMLLQGMGAVDRLFVPTSEEQAAHEALDRWLDARPPVIPSPSSPAPLFTSRDLGFAPETLRPPDLASLIIPPGILIGCYLFCEKVLELSVPLSLLCSLPLPIAVYLLIRSTQKSEKAGRSR